MKKVIAILAMIVALGLASAPVWAAGTVDQNITINATVEKWIELSFPNGTELSVTVTGSTGTQGNGTFLGKLEYIVKSNEMVTVTPQSGRTLKNGINEIPYYISPDFICSSMNTPTGETATLKVEVGSLLANGLLYAPHGVYTDTNMVTFTVYP